MKFMKKLLSTMTAASSRASNFFIFISSCDEWFVGSVLYAHNYTHEMHIVKRRCKKNTPSLSCKTSTKADKVHKSRKKHAKTGRKSRGLGADKMNNIRIYTEKPA